MQRIRLERPGGKKRIARVPFVENVVALFLVLVGSYALHSYSIYRISFDKNASMLVISVVILSGTTVLLTFANFLWHGYKKCLGAQRTLISDFGDGVVHISPSLFGWVACGKNWIATSSPPKDFLKMSMEEIENFAWGNSDGIFTKFIDDPEFSFPRIAVAVLRKRFWIFIPCRSTPMNSMVIFFNRKSQMLKWVEVIKEMKNGTLLETPDIGSQANKWQTAIKSKLLLFIGGSFAVLVQFVGIYATAPSTRIFIELLLMAPIIALVISRFLAADSSSVLPLMMSVRFTLAGGQKTHLAFDQLPVANAHLFLYDRLAMYPGIDCVSLSSIKGMTLENGESRIVEGDLKKLFKKGAPPENMVLRLYLDDVTDPEREINLPTETAQRWYSELKVLIGQSN